MFTPDFTAKLGEVVQAETDSFVALTRIAGLDPAKAYIGSDLSALDVGDDDLTGFCFHRADVRECNFSLAKGLTPAMFTGAIWDESTVFPPGFDPVQGWTQEA